MIFVGVTSLYQIFIDSKSGFFCLNPLQIVQDFIEEVYAQHIQFHLQHWGITKQWSVSLNSVHI